MGKLATTMELMRASWQVLRKDREMLLLPVLSGVCCLSAMVIFVVLAMEHGWLKQLSAQSPAGQRNIAYWIMFLYYYCNYFLVSFFNAAMIACAVIRLNGGDPTLEDGLRAAVRSLPRLAGWALIASTVGFVLGMVESRSQRVGRLVAALLGISWSVISYLAIPLIVVERSNPLFALDRSLILMRNAWGEQVAGNFSFGLVFTLFSLPVLPLTLIMFKYWGTPVFAATLFCTLFYLIILGILQSALQAIFNAVIYVFASDGRELEGFTPDLLDRAMGRS